MFRHDLSVEVGETVHRDGFVFADLALAGDSISAVRDPVHVICHLRITEPQRMRSGDAKTLTAEVQTRRLTKDLRIGSQTPKA